MSETEPSRVPTEETVQEERQCSACDTALVGPFAPDLALTRTAPEQEVAVLARAWTCPACGLVHWYVPEPDLEQLQSIAEVAEELAPKPGTSYERRMQVLRMLRRVRRM